MHGLREAHLMTSYSRLATVALASLAVMAGCSPFVGYTASPTGFSDSECVESVAVRNSGDMGGTPEFDVTLHSQDGVDGVVIIGPDGEQDGADRVLTGDRTVDDIQLDENAGVGAYQIRCVRGGSLVDYSLTSRNGWSGGETIESVTVEVSNT